MGGCTARFVYVFLYNICILFVNLVVWCETLPFSVVISARELSLLGGHVGLRTGRFTGTAVDRRP